MTEDNEQEMQILEGKAALDLWREGPDVWNSWIGQHPSVRISFAGVDFSSERDSTGYLSFVGYHFGDGDTDFSGALFGDGNVDFYNATFGEGTVNFFQTTFGDGNVNFVRTTFGGGELNFFGATFGEGDVRFIGTIFGDSDLDFYNANFGKGNVNFFKANFGDGNVNFANATFGDGEVKFSKAKFGNGDVSFYHTKLTELIFSPTAIGSCHIEAQGLSIESRAVFMLPPSATALKSFDLHGASFDGPLILSGNLEIIPDFRATRYSHQVELSALKVKLRRTWQGFGWPPVLSRVTEHPEDAAKLRRLKEIAETNKDHQAALRFSANENRARRWIETSWFGSVLDMAFSACSDYGQNILRPFIALLAIATVSTGAYKAMAATTVAAWWKGPGWGQSLLLSISNSLPFLPQSRDFRQDTLTALYPSGPSLYVDALMIAQGVLSFVFLFLIGLGLRNRFRL